MRAIDPSLSYRLLESGPIVLVSTSHAGRDNVMTMGFHMVIQHAPPLLGCVIGPWDHSYQALCEEGECVIAVPTVDMARKVVDIGNCTGADTDKFSRFKLGKARASHVQAPLLPQCLANIECRVADTRLVSRYNLFVLKAVAAWVDDERKERRTLHHNGNGTFNVDGRLLDLRERMTKWKMYQVDP